VTVGAVTSIADLLTDVYVTLTFWNDGKKGYFRASLVSLIASVVFQMFTVWAQNKKMGTKKVFKEFIPIWLGFKPAVDAYRVASGVKQEKGQSFNPMLEMTFMKGLEIFSEAIPGAIIQLLAIATSKGEIMNGVWISLTVSALTTGFTSASISYDWDTDPKNREQIPTFYGFIPPKASTRALVFVLMVLFSAGMLLIRCMTIVILVLAGSSWVALYIGGDFFVYLAVKTLQGDFWYWIPLGGKAEIVNSLICRVTGKVIVDFTSMVHFRHPNEIGGQSWLLGFVLTISSLPVAIILATSELTERTTSIAWSIVAIIIPGSLSCFAMFLFAIDRKYLHTFWSTQRGKDLTMSYFIEGQTDKEKFKVLSSSRHLWVTIEDDIKKWIQSNWSKWEGEEEMWFNSYRKAKVPVEFIPTTGDARRRESVRRASTDAEAEGGLGGALRASIRRASVGLGSRIDNGRVVPIEEDN
jgi:hypothetical protein